MFYGSGDLLTIIFHRFEVIHTYQGLIAGQKHLFSTFMANIPFNDLFRDLERSKSDLKENYIINDE